MNDKTPCIRFKGFTDDWEQRKLGTTNTFFTDGNYGEAYPKSSDMTDSSRGIPFLTGGNLNDGKLSLDGASYITPEKHSKLTSGHLLEDDIVIAVRGSLGALGYVNTDNSGWNINSQLAILRTGKSELYGKFLIQYLLSWTGQNELLKRQTGSALKQLSIGAIKDVEVPITSVAEQEKIGEYFADLDNLITLHQRKCDVLINVKKSMLEKMFPKNGKKVPEIRFEGFTDDWEQRKFGDGMDLLTGFPFESEKFSDNGINLIRGMNVKRGYLDLSDSLCMKWKSSEGLEKYLLENEDILIQMDGALIGKSYAKIKESQLPALLVQRVTRARAIPEDSNSDFMYQTIQRDFLKYIILNKTDSAVPHLSLNDIREFPIRVPNLEEQKKIGEYLYNLDNLIALHQRKLEKLQNIKKSMLEKMFI